MSYARAGISVYFNTPQEADAARLAVGGSPDADRVPGALMLAAEQSIVRALDRYRERFGDWSEDTALDDERKP